MRIKDDVIAFLNKKQKQLIERYARLEDIQGEYKELYSLCQREMDRTDWNAELICRKIFELEQWKQEIVMQEKTEDREYGKCKI